MIVRLARPLPSNGRAILAQITLDGGGGYEGVVHAVPASRRRAHAYCYEQVLESDAQQHNIPGLDHPHEGARAEVVLSLTHSMHGHLKTVIHLAHDRDPNPDSGKLLYERRLGCVRKG